MRRPCPARRADLTGLAVLVLWPIAWSLYVWGQRGADTSDIEFALRGGALSRELLVSEPWRVFTAPLLHLDVRHLLSNVIAIVAIGLFAVRLLGGLRVWVVAHISAWTGAGVALLAPGMVLGLSGGFFGVLGSIIGSLLRTEARKNVPKVIAMGILAVLLLVVTPGDALAHAGGGVAGAIAGWVMTSGRRDALPGTRGVWILATLIALANLTACLMVLTDSKLS